MASDRCELTSLFDQHVLFPPISIHLELRRSHQREQVGHHEALATPGNSEHKGVHRDEPRPNPQPCSGIGWLVTQLSLRFPEQSKDKLGTTKF